MKKEDEYYSDEYIDSYEDSDEYDVPAICKDKEKDKDAKFFKTLETLNVASSSIEHITTVIAEMNARVTEVRAQVEVFTKLIDTDFEKYKSRLPIVENQLESVSKRMDKFVDKILDDDSPITTEYLQKQSMLLNALTQMSSDYNSLLEKLI